MFYQSVVPSIILYAVVCWGDSINEMLCSWTGELALWLALGWTDGSKGKDPVQIVVYHGQRRSPSAYHCNEIEYFLWQAAVIELLNRQAWEILCPWSHKVGGSGD